MESWKNYTRCRKLIDGKTSATLDEREGISFQVLWRGSSKHFNLWWMRLNSFRYSRIDRSAYQAHPVLAPCHPQPCLLGNFQASNFSVPKILKFLFQTRKSNRWDACSKCKPGIIGRALEWGPGILSGPCISGLCVAFQYLFSFIYHSLHSKSLLATLLGLMENVRGQRCCSIPNPGMSGWNQWVKQVLWVNIWDCY